MKALSIILIFILLIPFSCSNKLQEKSEIFRLSKQEVFLYLNKNDLVRDSTEIKRITKHFEFPKKTNNPIIIRYFIENEEDSLWIEHAYLEEYLKDDVIFIKLSPKLKNIIIQKQNNKPYPRYDRYWSGGMYEY